MEPIMQKICFWVWRLWGHRTLVRCIGPITHNTHFWSRKRQSRMAHRTSVRWASDLRNSTIGLDCWTVEQTWCRRGRVRWCTRPVWCHLTSGSEWLLKSRSDSGPMCTGLALCKGSMHRIQWRFWEKFPTAIWVVGSYKYTPISPFNRQGLDNKSNTLEQHSQVIKAF